MALKQRLDEGDLALAFILQDPIAFPEFMRNTRDGSKNKDTWPKKPFKYRWYQKDLLSDKSPEIVLQGGRSIGKCQVRTDRVYTENGYIPIGQLKGKSLRVWAFDGEKLVLRRAICGINGMKQVYRIETESGNVMYGTKEHPVFTAYGWKQARDIVVGDRVATLTKLPHIPSASLPNDEVSFMGVSLFKDWNSLLSPKRYKNIAIIKAITDKTRVILRETHEGYHFSKTYKRTHPIHVLFNYYGFNFIRRWKWVQEYKLWHIPIELRRLNEENLRYFLGAILSEYAEITTTSFLINVPSSVVGKDLQELFLRFGIETRLVPNKQTEYRKRAREQFNMIDCDLVSLDHRAVYRALRELYIPRYSIGKLKEPAQQSDATDFYRYDPVISVSIDKSHTYMLEVEEDHTYISENLIQHNSFVLEDKMIFDVMNHKKTLQETKEYLLTTANQNQMTPLITKFVARCMSSPILRSFSQKGINRQTGMMKFHLDDTDVVLHIRIAGSKTENNVIGLHIPRIYIDETQVYPLGAWRQLQPTLNF